MVEWLQNKNRTDRPKITIETLKETVDKFDIVFFILFLLNSKGCRFHHSFVFLFGICSKRIFELKKARIILKKVLILIKKF